ncbi:DUF4416 family protein [Desulfovibrio aminophilus]|nr:DUF4416 family protein [Desulfovibrio aminophilus]MCM0756700.1 DUF4416 family protein [Desulfovibrio aminophilus]
MSAPRVPEPGLLVLSVLCAEWEACWPELSAALEERFGPADFVSGFMDFGHTAYYDRELGAPLRRRMLAFERLVPLDCLPEAKLFTNGLERAGARPDGGRRFNLDPGVLTQERLILATGKNFTHRVYLGQGIWADLTLVYTGGGWLVLPWTFPDYAAPDMLELLSAMREHYRRKIFVPRGDNPGPQAPDEERKDACPRA